MLDQELIKNTCATASSMGPDSIGFGSLSKYDSAFTLMVLHNTKIAKIRNKYKEAYYDRQEFGAADRKQKGGPVHQDPNQIKISENSKFDGPN